MEQQEAPNTANRVAWARVAKTGANFSTVRSQQIYAGSIGVSPYPSPDITQVPRTAPYSTAEPANRPRRQPKHGQITNDTTADFTLRYFDGPNGNWL